MRFSGVEIFRGYSLSNSGNTRKCRPFLYLRTLQKYVALFLGPRFVENSRDGKGRQENLASFDIQQIQAELDGATIRQVIMERDLEIHDKSVEQAQARDNFYRRKFGTSDLYQWMAGRLSTAYFQTYKLALDVARSAEKAYQYERNTDNTLITSGYWDSLKKGLLAGEGLMLTLNQLEKAFMDDHSREFEIEKTISLFHRDQKLVSQLKTEGTCTIILDEKLFHDDFPDHYCRKIKSIAITIPAVVGPYQNVNATLRQTSNRVLLKPDTAGRNFLLGNSKDSTPPDTVRSDWRPQQQIAISRGVDDSGMFQLDFRDERYLPFEGTGAISEWELTLPHANNSVDLINSISDVIIHLRYTALDGSDGFK